ncbi:MAG: alpha/beta fold hydrolase [Alphaproteobacteria bacterium]|nr:alpha/beta fold hydrolase [Alphaproteobacteria bacterium]
MRQLVLLLTVFALPLAACGEAARTGPETVQTVEAEPDTGVTHDGDWAGTLNAGGAQLRLILEVRGETAVLISVDQGGARLPVEVTQSDADGFAGTIASVGASLELDRIDDTTLAGMFSQGGADLPLTLSHTGADSAPAEAEAATGTDPVFGQDADIQIMSGGVSLAGSLRRPEGAGPFPAILLLNGSGAQDRNATVAGQPLFGVLADTLAARGIASLRLDDRGVGGSDAVAPASPHDLANDAAAAMAALRDQEGIAGRCVGVLGHSEGGMIAFLAAGAADPAFLLSLAGMHMTMAQTLYDQSEALILASGAGQAAADQNRALQDAMFAVMRDETIEDYPAALTEALTAQGFPQDTARQQGAVWGQDYSIASLDLDPAAAISAYDGPVHAIFGERDLQALAGPQSQALLAARGDLPTEVTVVPGVNHLFQEAETGLPQEYANAPHVMSPGALSAIAYAAEALINETCETE